MSWNIIDCSKCNRQCNFESVQPFAGGDGTYVVSWYCSTCDIRAMDLCPIGPTTPRHGVCLNCGADTSASLCDVCKLEAAEIEIRVNEATSNDEASIDNAQMYAGRGQIRLAFNIIDLHLRDYPHEVAAWTEKGRLLSLVGYFEQSRQALDCAISHAESSDRPHILHLRANALCELHLGKAALQDIDESLKNEPDQVSRNYIRGRALGLVGRIDEALVCMNRVLELAPDHDAARRARALCENAVRSQCHQPWWKFWG